MAYQACSHRRLTQSVGTLRADGRNLGAGIRDLESEGISDIKIIVVATSYKEKRVDQVISVVLTLLYGQERWVLAMSQRRSYKFINLART